MDEFNFSPSSTGSSGNVSPNEFQSSEMTLASTENRFVENVEIDDIRYSQANTQALTAESVVSIETSRSVVSESPELNLHMVATQPDQENNDEDVIPPSPEPSKIQRSVSLVQAEGVSSSAFVALATGSSFQGSLNLLKNLPAVQSFASGPAKEIVPTPRAIRQINFDTDSNSSNSCPNESPSCFVSETGKVQDQNIPKPVPSRGDIIEIVEVVTPKSDVQGNDTINLDVSPDFCLRLSPSQPGEANTQDNNEGTNAEEETPKEFRIYKGIGSLENISGHVDQQFSTPNEVNAQNLLSFGSAEANLSNGANLGNASQLANASISPEAGENYFVVDTRTSFFNPDTNEVVVFSGKKVIPRSKIDLMYTTSGRFQLGIWDNLDLSKSHDISTGSNGGVNSGSSSTYHGDVSTSLASRASVMSTFEAGHLPTTQARSSFTLEGTVTESEFAVPRHPVRGRVRSSPASPGNKETTFVSPPAEVAQVAERFTALKRKTAAAKNVPDLRSAERKRQKIPAVIEEPGAGKESPRKRVRKSRTPKKKLVGEPNPEETADASGGNHGKQGDKQPESQAQQPQAEGGGGNGDQPTPGSSSSTKTADDLIEEISGDIAKLLNRDLEIGARVFAPWYDMKYYAGHIIGRHERKENCWVVKFFSDGNTREVFKDQIVNLAVLPRGQSLLVLRKGIKAAGHSPSGIVTGHKNVKNEVHYVVELDNGETLQVGKEDIVLTKDQVQLFHETAVWPRLFSPGTFSVSLDNIVSGKRTRRVRGFESPAPASPRTPRSTRSKNEDAGFAPTPPSSRKGTFRRRPRGKRDPILESSTLTETTQTSLSSTLSETRSRIIRRLQLDPAQSARSVGELEHPETEVPGEGVELCPLPTSQIFHGYVFILTRSTHPLEVEPEEAPDEVLDFLDLPPFNKDHIRRVLEAGGGEVLDRFDEAHVCVEKTVVLVANRPCRTERYVRALAADFPIVSNRWVESCCKWNKLSPVDHYRLPCGFNLNGELVDWKERTKRPLSGLQILLANKDKSFLDLWQPILIQAGCTMVSRQPPRKSEDVQLEPYVSSIDYIVTNKNCPERIIEMGRDLNYLVLSTEWVVQCLITGERLDPTTRDEFRVLFDEK